MPDAGSEKETSREKETGSRRGEVTSIAGGLHQGPVGPKGRWSKRRKAEVVIRILRGEPLDSLSRELGVEIYRLEEWRDKALASMEAGLSRREGDPVQEQLDCAMKKIGEMAMENELLRKRCEAKESLRQRRPRR
jgi:transposase